MLLFRSLASSQLRNTCTGTLPGETAGTATVICVGATANIGALAPPKVTQRPANFVESWPPLRALIWAAAPEAMKFDP